MRSLRLLLALSALWMAGGCEIVRVLTLKPDGSGEIAEHYLMPLDLYSKEKKPNAKDESAGLQMSVIQPTAQSVEKGAADFGEGVKLVSYKPLQTKDMLGYDAVYEFPDINKVHLASLLQQGGKSAAPGEAPAANEANANFRFTKGAVNELVIPLKGNQPDKDDAKDTIPPATADPKQTEAFTEALKHIEMRTAIRVVGHIEETNAHFRKDNEVVLFEMNLKGMAADPKYAQLFKDAAAGKTKQEEWPEDERYDKHEKEEVVKIRFK